MMMMMEETGSPASIAPYLLRNFITSMFVLADKSLSFLAEKSQFLQALRYILVSSFLFFLRILPSFFPSLIPSESNATNSIRPNLKFKKKRGDSNHVPATGGGRAGGGAVVGGTGDSGIARALSQLLAIVNDIPVSSRKYDVVRSLAEKIIDENLSEGNEALRQVNCSVLSSAFGRTLSQLESAMMDYGRNYAGDFTRKGTTADRDEDYYSYYASVSRFMRAVRYCRDAVLFRPKSSPGDEMSRSGGNSAEKLAAELLWLSQKMAACGCGEEAVNKWASASSLAWLSLTTEPRLQGYIVKISAFLFKKAKEIGREVDEESKREQQRETKLKMLLLWIPLLCRATIGTDSPVLSVSERAELERTLEDIIESLKQQEDQEKVLSLWLHHFTYCPSSDWPNLHGCYARWCTASRRNLLQSR
ncbi:OLC1v1002646C1 [Oldenlandia corymbosa var. corymbosa]|uniref:OLC1v1002646C1 n=1 Tax=Oldenlandia corymbosa var. corymbosa TaxID=529605 RepID=A0AAV1D866_OLDCO|nr:OLC1v1002646C1 [Oldenlandia corymbosa var. corymbosa]